MTFSGDEVKEHADLLEDMSKGVVMNYHPVLSRAMARAAEMLRELSRERAVQPGRCPKGKSLRTEAGVTIASRCKKNLQGHGATHEARGLDEFPMLNFTWFDGDEAEFETDRNDFYAWEM